jgi:hypothetical protein
MDEIRCPMCGKLNPPDLENCQYCQARLKPLIVSQSPDEDESISLSPNEEGDFPDWLRKLREQNEQPQDRDEFGFDEEQTAEETGEVDWLKQLREQSATEDEEHAVGESESVPFLDEASVLGRLEDVEPDDESSTRPEDAQTDKREVGATWSSSMEESGKDDLPEWLKKSVLKPLPMIRVRQNLSCLNWCLLRQRTSRFQIGCPRLDLLKRRR